MTFKRSNCLRNVVLLVAALLAPAVYASAEEPLQMRVYEDGVGRRFFAASIAPIAAEVAPTEVAIVFDTSASQTGMHRETALAAVEACLASLGDRDSVRVFVADLTTRELTTGVATPQEAAAAVAKLKEITPLGSTDLPRAIRTAADRLAESEATRRALLYVGDGVDSSGKFSSPEMLALAEELRANRITVSSYAVGPGYDACVLAAVANLTGGNLYLDDPITLAHDTVTVERATEENRARGARVGRILADWVRATVVWPEHAHASISVAAFYPNNLPPLRSDRDSIVIGRLRENAETIRLQAKVDGAAQAWVADTPEANETHAYLVDLVESAARDGGARLTTLGTAGLEETGRVLLASMERLNDLAERAVSLGDTEGAARLSEAVLRRDPGNPRAKTVQALTRKNKKVRARGVAHHEGEGELSLIRTEPIEALPGPAVVSEGFVDTGDYPPAEIVVDGRYLNAVERNNQVFEQMLEKEVQNSVADARDLMAENPQAAIQDLKQMLASVEATTELVASVRAGLIDKLQSALREASRQAVIKEDLDRQRLEALAATREQRDLLDSLEQRKERTAQLINRFNSLIEEGEYELAREVASVAVEEEPYEVAPRVARVWGQMRTYHDYNMKLRAERAEGFLNAMYQVEKSFIPFPDDPPIVYPDAEFWAEMTERRKEYATVDVAGQSESEAAISAALSSPLTSAGLDFTDTPLEEVVAFLKDEYQIEIQLDTQGLDDLGIGADEPIDVSLRNISLRSALRLMLKPLELTYVIDDEVLLITSEDEALTRLSVKVYPVADLVLPIITPQVGGLGGGLGGGGGGGLGGGGGGGLGGGGGGGLGGGGGGFGGGGGGQFSVPDESADNTASLGGDSIALPEVGEPLTYWDTLFESSTPDPQAVRIAARRLMKAKRFDQVVALLEAALRTGHPQHWMYESLGIAMTLDGRDDADIERAVTSAVDFARSPEQLLAIADYLVGLELYERAVQVCRLAASRDPMLQEAYALGLRAAKRSDDVDSLRWATSAILSQAWPHEEAALVTVARRTAEAVVVRLQSEGDSAAADFRDAINQAAERDCVIKVSWTGEADVDLAVEEPGGSLCWVGQPRTTSGGVSLGDATGVTADGRPAVHEEAYVCPRGFTGDYRLAVRKVWGEVTADTVTVEVTLHTGTEREETIKRAIRLEEGKDSVVEFTLADGRRDQPLEEQQLAQAIRRQQAIGQAVLSQQLSSLADGGATSLRPDEARRRRLALARGGAVGFQPVIITLPEGQNFQASAVVSSDRRYVRVTPVPFFSFISGVDTFTFAGAEGADNAGGGAGGGAAGGAGGAAGGGGGALGAGT